MAGALFLGSSYLALGTTPLGLVNSLDGGTITIDIVARSTTEIAPESILFGVDLSAASFDTAGPTGSEVYDARQHDLQYYWTFSDTGTWSNLTNALTEWKNRNTARAPFPTHLFRADGTYEVAVTVVEPSSGKSASATLNVTVGDPDTYYSGTDTICVNNVGDSDFTGKPTGAAEINVDELLKLSDGTTTTEWANREGGNPKRWLFKRGGDWEVSLRLDADDTRHITFGAYGTGADPILRTPATPAATEEDMFHASSHYGGAGQTPELRFQGIDFKSTHDPTTIKMDEADPNFVGTRWLFWNEAIYIAAVDCNMDGFGGSTMGIQDSGSSTSDRRVHLDGCNVTNAGGFYPFIVSCENNATSTFSLTGCTMINPPDAFADQSSTTIRFNSANYLYVKGLEVFTTDSQGCFSVFKTSTQDGYNGFIEGYYGEGGDGQMDIATNLNSTTQRPHVHNLIVDGACLVGTWGTGRPIYALCTGMTIRNVLCYEPDSTSYIERPRCFIELEHNTTSPWTGPLPSYVTDAPINLHNNTWVLFRDLTTVRPFISTAKPYSDFTAVTQENNVIEQENNSSTTETTWSPLTDALLFTTYAGGRRDVTSGTYDTNYATTNVLDSKPDTGSAALNAATTGLRAWYDFTHAERLDGNDAGTIDKGAWQVS